MIAPHLVPRERPPRISPWSAFSSPPNSLVRSKDSSSSARLPYCWLANNARRSAWHLSQFYSQAKTCGPMATGIALQRAPNSSGPLVSSGRPRTSGATDASERRHNPLLGPRVRPTRRRQRRIDERVPQEERDAYISPANRPVTETSMLRSNVLKKACGLR